MEIRRLVLIASSLLVTAAASFGAERSVVVDATTKALIAPTAGAFISANGIQVGGARLEAVRTNTGTVDLSGLTLTLGNITVGSLSGGTWQGNAVAGQYGGTGVANTGKTITLGGNLSTTGAFNTTLAQAASITITLPASSTTLPIATQQLTFTGPTAARTITLPDAAFTVARTDAAQTIAGVQTFSSSTASTSSSTGAVVITGGLGVGGTIAASSSGVVFPTSGVPNDVFIGTDGSSRQFRVLIGGILKMRVDQTGVLLVDTITSTSSGAPSFSAGLTTTTLSTTGAATLSPSNAAVTLSPTGTGTVTLNPATTGTLNNITIGGTTARAGTFTTLAASTFSGDGAALTNLTAGNLATGLVATTRGGVMSYQPNKTHNAEDVLRAGTRPLRVLGIGDSAIEYPMRRMLLTMAQAVGRAGGNNDAASWIQYSGTATELTITELWNQGGLMAQVTSGQYRDYVLQYGDHLAVCDRIVVGYVRRSGAGTFKVQSRTVDGGSWTDEGSTVSTANATVDYQTLSITPSGGTIGRQFRILGVSGTVQFANPVVERTTGRGIMQCLVPVAGADFDGYTTSTTAVRRAWLDSIAPDVIFIRYYDLIATLEAGIVALKADLVALGRDHTTDVVLMAPTPITSGDPAAHLVYHQQCKALAATYGLAYVSTYEGFETRFLTGDGVHPTSDGWNWIGDETLRQLRWLDIPEVQLAAKHVDFNPSYQTIPDSTTLSALAQPKVNLVPGWWRIRGHLIWASTGTGQGLQCKMVYSGSADYMRGVHLSSGAEGTAWPTSVIPRIGIGAQYFPFNLVLSSLTAAQNGGINVDLVNYFYTPGALSLQVAKEATGGSGYIFEGTSLQAERIAD